MAASVSDVLNVLKDKMVALCESIDLRDSSEDINVRALALAHLAEAAAWLQAPSQSHGGGAQPQA